MPSKTTTIRKTPAAKTQAASKNRSVRFPPAVLQALEKEAARQNRSVNYIVNDCIRKFLN